MNQKVIINTKKEISMIDLYDVLYIQSVPNYSEFIFISNKPLLIDCCLNKLEQRLPQDLFIRIHKSFIINIWQIRKVQLVKNYKIFLNGNKILPLSKSRKVNFLERLNKLDINKCIIN